MDEKLRQVIEQIKDVPGLKIGWVFCEPYILTVDSEVHDYESALRLDKYHRENFKQKPERYRSDYEPPMLMPVFWIDEDGEVEEDDEYRPSQSLKKGDQ